MRLLIAGGQGQVAKAMIDVAPSRSDITSFAVGRPALDICQVATIERQFADIKPDVVINTAAYTAVDQAESEPDRAMALNRDGARALAMAAARRGVPIIHLSTDYVFNGRSKRPYVEADAPAPETVYGATKLEGEQAVRAANPKHLILRTAWVYSPFGRNFVKTVLQRARDGQALRIVADQRGSPTYAPHLVEAIFALAAQAAAIKSNDDARWGLYHAAGAGSATWYDVAERVLLSAGMTPGAQSLTQIATSDYPTPARRPAFSELDCGKLTSVFGIRLPDWRDGVTECVRRLSQPA